MPKITLWNDSRKCFSSPLFQPNQKKERYFLFQEIAQIKEKLIHPILFFLFLKKKTPGFVLIWASTILIWFNYASVNQARIEASVQEFLCMFWPSIHWRSLKWFVSGVHLSTKDLSSVLYKPLTTALCLAIEYDTVLYLCTYNSVISLYVCVWPWLN